MTGNQVQLILEFQHYGGKGRFAGQLNLVSPSRQNEQPILVLVDEQAEFLADFFARPQAQSAKEKAEKDGPPIPVLAMNFRQV